MYCQTTLCIPPVEKHWAVTPRYHYMQDNEVLWKVGTGDDDDSDSSVSDMDENIRQENGRDKKAMFFLMLHGAAILK